MATRLKWIVLCSCCPVRTSGLALVSSRPMPGNLISPTSSTSAEATFFATSVLSTSVVGSELRRDGPLHLSNRPGVNHASRATRGRRVLNSMVKRSMSDMNTESRGCATTSVGEGVATSATGRDESDGKEGLVVKVRQEDHNAPIDWLLSRRLPIMSRRFYRRALEEGRVKVDGRTVKRFIRVACGSMISVDSVRSTSAAVRDGDRALETPPNYLLPQRMPELRVLYDDQHCAVVAKPAGMVCQPCEAVGSGTVLHGLLDYTVRKNRVEDSDALIVSKSLSQGVVQHLDKATSGVMLVAKSLEAASKFSGMFNAGAVKQQYVAICHGDPGFDSVVDASLYRRSSGKTGAVPRSQAAEFGAKNAQTRVRNIATAGGMSLCRADVTNARMHQVRVHLKWKRCPVVGDKDYGDSEANQRMARRGNFRVNSDRQLLHSMSLEFTHPFTDKRMFFQAPMPMDMWETAEAILRASGTSQQRQEFNELQESQRKPAPIGGRGAPRVSRKRGGRGSASSRKARAAVIAADIVDR